MHGLCEDDFARLGEEVASNTGSSPEAAQAQNRSASQQLGSTDSLGGGAEGVQSQLGSAGYQSGSGWAAVVGSIYSQEVSTAYPAPAHAAHGSGSSAFYAQQHSGRNFAYGLRLGSQTEYAGGPRNRRQRADQHVEYAGFHVEQQPQHHNAVPYFAEQHGSGGGGFYAQQSGRNSEIGVFPQRPRRGGSDLSNMQNWQLPSASMGADAVAQNASARSRDGTQQTHPRTTMEYHTYSPMSN